MEVKLEGADKLAKTLARLAEKYNAGNTESITVGFTQRYALHVHEVQARHVVGQWKYLETPARSMTREMARTIEVALKRQIHMRQALMLAGLGLQRAAQLLTPVDTSALKASAFTCPTRDVEATSAAAFSRSEAIRLAELAAKNKKSP